MKTAFLLLGMLLAVPSFAGHEGGGGDVVSVNGKKNLLDLVEGCSCDVEYVDAEAVMNSFNKSLQKLDWDWFFYGLFRGTYGEGNNPYLFSKFIMVSVGATKSNSILEPYFIQKPTRMTFYFTNEPLDELNDEGTINLSQPYTKDQLAIQNKDGIVVINKSLFEELSKKDQAGLIMHEVLLRFVWQYNPSHLSKFGTEKIRKLNRQIMKVAAGEYVPEEVLTKAFKDLGVDNLSRPL